MHSPPGCSSFGAESSGPTRITRELQLSPTAPKTTATCVIDVTASMRSSWQERDRAAQTSSQLAAHDPAHVCRTQRVSPSVALNAVYVGAAVGALVGSVGASVGVDVVGDVDGAVLGATVGIAVGALLGAALGSALGAPLGAALVGAADGAAVGITVGAALGACVGATLGAELLGAALGACVGATLGAELLGAAVGVDVAGLAVGSAVVGVADGATLGAADGPSVGVDVGTSVGCDVGDDVGDDVGAFVGQQSPATLQNARERPSTMHMVVDCSPGDCVTIWWFASAPAIVPSSIPLSCEPVHGREATELQPSILHVPTAPLHVSTATPHRIWTSETVAHTVDGAAGATKTPA